MVNLYDLHAVDESNEKAAGCSSSSNETKQWEQWKTVGDAGNCTTYTLLYKKYT